MVRAVVLSWATRIREYPNAAPTILQGSRGLQNASSSVLTMVLEKEKIYSTEWRWEERGRAQSNALSP